MIGSIELFLRRTRRALSRSEWLARLLGLPVSMGTETAPGLVMLQIDGLSRPEFERALRAGEMPFLRRLMRREHYRLHRLYPGVPTSTAAVQGELFYGVRAGVPGFSFREHSTGNLVRMYEQAPAARAERELEAQGDQPLLRGGSAYVDNFTGGAAEPHFCPSSLGWGQSLRQANPFAVAVLVASNAFSFVRAVLLMLLEAVIAISDCARGLIAGENVIRELLLVPSRVVVTILLRELATIGAEIDVARGLPIVHVNFLGYDEQAHRRGPTSRFAHWSLKGIDRAIMRIWRAAHRSGRRHYDVWVYSDHGQEESRPYESLHGTSLADAVGRVFAEHEGRPVRFRSSGRSGEQLQRATLFGARRHGRASAVDDPAWDESDAPLLTVAELGPVAMIYCERRLASQEQAALAGALLRDARVPLVLAAGEHGGARAWMDERELALPRDGAEVLGANHPHGDLAARDLAALCHHPDAGDLVLCGWRAGASPVSFTAENGAHGGAGPNETDAFALLPEDAPVADQSGHLRPADLRAAALRFLERDEGTRRRRGRRSADQKSLRIMTYNVHSCIGMDGRMSPERIARVIARYRPDIVALQELDVGRARSNAIDQAQAIAHLLEMEFHFHPAIHLEEERYGDAVLSHLPMRLVRGAALPCLGVARFEPRGALWVAIDVGGVELQLINTHLSLLPRERLVQTETLMGPDWLGHPDCRSPVVLCGDLNALPTSPVCRQLGRGLRDAQLGLAQHRPRGTFFGRFAAVRIDHVFVDSALEVLDVEVPNTQLTRVASDHLPVIVELQQPS